MEEKPYLTLDDTLSEIRENIMSSIKRLQSVYKNLELERCMLKTAYETQAQSIIRQQADTSRQINLLYQSLESYTPKNINDLDD